MDIFTVRIGGIRGTVVTLWTAGQQVERSILCQGHNSQQYLSHLPKSPAQYSLTVQNHSQNTIHYIHSNPVDKFTVRMSTEHYGKEKISHDHLGIYGLHVPHFSRGIL